MAPPLPRLMAITPGTLTGTGRVLDELCAHLSGLATAGVRLFQFREKQLDTAQARLAFERCEAATRPGATWLVNGDVAGAPMLLTGGIHLPASAPCPPGSSRLLWGRSIHSAQELGASRNRGAAYVIASPVYAPSTKNMPGLGIHWLRELCEVAAVPVFALGGISPERVPACLEAGAYGVAVLSGLMHAPDPHEAAQRYLEAVEQLP